MSPPAASPEVVVSGGWGNTETPLVLIKALAERALACRVAWSLRLGASTIFRIPLRRRRGGLIALRRPFSALLLTWSRLARAKTITSPLCNRYPFQTHSTPSILSHYHVPGLTPASSSSAQPVKSHTQPTARLSHPVSPPLLKLRPPPPRTTEPCSRQTGARSTPATTAQRVHCRRESVAP